jgi:hypothetical protein
MLERCSYYRFPVMPTWRYCSHCGRATDGSAPRTPDARPQREAPVAEQRTPEAPPVAAAPRPAKRSRRNHAPPPSPDAVPPPQLESPPPDHDAPAPPARAAGRPARARTRAPREPLFALVIIAVILLAVFIIALFVNAATGGAASFVALPQALSGEALAGQGGGAAPPPPGASISGVWVISVEPAVGEGESTQFRVLIDQDGGGFSGRGDGLALDGQVAGMDVAAFYERDGTRGSFVWELSEEADRMRGSFTAPDGNGGASSAVRVR